MLDEHRMGVLKTLRNLRYPYIVEGMIKGRLERIKYSKTHHGESHGHFCYARLQMYEANIVCLQEIRRRIIKEAKLSVAFSSEESKEEIMKRVVELKNNTNRRVPEVQAKVSFPESGEEIRKLAYEIALYFSQGYEMYKTSMDMDISSSPILEYYALLQIVKGIILLELEVHPQEFLGAHGLERRKANDESILQVKVKTHGVFAALLLRTSMLSENKEGIISSKLGKQYSDYFPKFEDLVDKQIVYRDIPETFIFAWILSEIARYQPKKWREICLGENNNWINSINDFREEGIPKAIFALIDGFCN